MSDNQLYLPITGRTIVNQLATFPDGILGITAQNVGDTNATITFNDGSTIPIRRNGGIFSLDATVLGYKGFSINAAGTTVDYVATGVIATSITIA